MTTTICPHCNTVFDVPVPELSMTWPQYLERKASVGGNVIKLGRTTHEVLTMLLMNRGKVVSFQDLSTMLWSECPEGGPLDDRGAIGVHVWRLRQAGVNVINMSGRGFLIEQPAA